MTLYAKKLVESIQRAYRDGKQESKQISEVEKKQKIKQYREFFGKSGNFTYEYRGYPVSAWMVPHEFATTRPCFDPCLNSPCSTFDLIRAHEQDKIILQEALIKTYPVSTLLRAFKKMSDDYVVFNARFLKMSDFGIKRFGNQMVRDTYELNGMNDITGIANQVIVYAPFASDEDAYEFEKALIAAAQSRGYGLSKSGIDEDAQSCNIGDAEVLLYFFTLEAQYSIAKFKMNDTMMHVVPVNVLHKVASDGLHPRTSKDVSFTYKPSVYLFNYADESVVIDYGTTKAQNVGQHQFAILKVDSRKLMSTNSFKSGANQFFVDQKMPSIDDNEPQAVYTYGNVPLSCINDEIELISFDDDGIVVEKSHDKLSNFK